MSILLVAHKHTHMAWTLDWHPEDVNSKDGPLQQRWIWDVNTKLRWVILWPALSDHCLPSRSLPPSRLILCLLGPSLTQRWEKNESCVFVRICSSQHLSITSSPMFLFFSFFYIFNLTRLSTLTPRLGIVLCSLWLNHLLISPCSCQAEITKAMKVAQSSQKESQ